MSVLEFVQELSTVCRIPGCTWFGNFSELEKHFNIFHPKQVIEINSSSYFELTFDDLVSDQPLLLTTDNGAYWLAWNENEQRPEQFSRGLFAIEKSERVQYHIKLGTFATRIMEMLGPFEAQNEESNQYDFDMSLEYMQQLRNTMTPKVAIYFGDFEEEHEEEYDEFDQLSPSQAIESEPDNGKYSTFICTTCVKTILGEPILFRDRHYLCNNCHYYVLVCLENQGNEIIC